MEITNELQEFDISAEEYREYDWNGRIYRINFPEKLYFRKNGTTHRILDSDGIVHCLPIPGQNGCVLRWKNKQNYNPVQF